MFRSKAGQMTAPGEKNGEEEEASSTNFLHNSHWIKDPHHSGPSRYVGYYDAASLYPSSSKFFFFDFNTRLSSPLSSPSLFLTLLQRIGMGGGGQVLKKYSFQPS